jgi:hypothetical protein
MKDISGSVGRIYNFLLRLYPRSFRSEFEEQMLLDFADMVADAREKGKLFFILFFLRELVDFPVNLIRVHFQEGPMFRSQPVNFGLRNALGFGIGFAVITLSSLWISRLLFPVFEPVLNAYSVWYYDTFHNERWIGLLDSLVQLLSYALTGISFGLVFSLLAGTPRRRGKYFLAGSLAWLTPSLISHAISDSFGWSYFLKDGQSTVLGVSLAVLMGVFWGAGIGFAESDRKVSTRYLVGAAFGYPLATYLFVRLLFSLWLEITPWFFISLLLLMIVFITSVVAVAISIDRKTLWTMVGGVAGCLILDRVAVYIAYQLLHLPQFPLNSSMLQDHYFVYEISWAAYEAIFGVLLGLMLGLIFGYQRKNMQPQLEEI